MKKALFDELVTSIQEAGQIKRGKAKSWAVSTTQAVWTYRPSVSKPGCHSSSLHC
jgi:hypothetical protein